MFDINQKVVCINDTFWPGINDIFSALPKKGVVYTVRDLCPGLQTDMNQTLAILLHEIVTKPNPHGIEPGFRYDRFAELEEQQEEQIEKNVAELVALMEEYPELRDSPPLC